MKRRDTYNGLHWSYTTRTHNSKRGGRSHHVELQNLISSDQGFFTSFSFNSLPDLASVHLIWKKNWRHFNRFWFWNQDQGHLWTLFNRDFFMYIGKVVQLVYLDLYILSIFISFHLIRKFSKPYFKWPRFFHEFFLQLITWLGFSTPDLKKNWR